MTLAIVGCNPVCEGCQVSNELTDTLPPNDEDRTTQPTITAVFELIQNVKQVVDTNATRLNDVELQIQNVKQVVDNIATRQNDMDLQIKSGFSTLGYKFDALNRGRLQTEADYYNLLQRIEELETKTS